MATPRGITINKQSQTIYNAASGHGYRFTANASDGLNMDINVFRYSGGLSEPAVFDGICSPEQMASLPIGTPSQADPNQYFRLNTLDLIFTTQAAANVAWSAIQSEIYALIRALKASDNLSPTTSIRIGD